MFRLLFIILFLNSLLFCEDEKLPSSFLKDLDGKKINITELNNTVMAISFWFLACEPCKKEMKYLDMFNSKYGKYGFKVVSINTDNSRTLNRVKPYIKSKKYSFQVLSDPKSLFFRKLGGQQCPYLVLVDEDGNIINKHIGYSPGDEINLEKEIVHLISDTIKSDSTLTDSSIIKLISSNVLENSKIDDGKSIQKLEIE